MAALFGIFSLFLARDVALFVNYRTDGVSYRDAQKDFGDLMRSNDHGYLRVGISLGPG